MTDSQLNIPEFIIVGTMKSGTSSLMHQLRRHPEIHTPDKELHFFNRKANYEKGIDWYKEVLLKNKPDAAKVIGEKTPTYSYQADVAEKIYKDFPNVKLIWVFRNPVDRTYSNYLHALKQGVDYYTFEKAIKKEEKRIQKNIFMGYKQRSIYVRQVENYLRFFPKENMFFLLFEDLIQPYGEKHVLNDLFDFLGVSKTGFQYERKPSNPTRLPKHPKVLYYVRKFGLHNKPGAKQLLDKLHIDAQTESYEKMSIKTRTELVEYFKPYNKELEKLIGLDLSVWNK